MKRKTMYWRIAYLTKLVGSISLSITIEDDLLSIDNHVYLYIPQLEQINQYIESAIRIEEFNKYVSPNYKMNLVTKEITIRHLLENMYDFELDVSIACTLSDYCKIIKL